MCGDWKKMKKNWVLRVWKMILKVIWWTTWKEMNQHIFVGKELSFQDFNFYFLRTLYSWSQVLNGGTNSNFLEFLIILSTRLEGMIFL